jgi:RNA polymerase sigma-70 factor, ECF subfamily
MERMSAREEQGNALSPSVSELRRRSFALAYRMLGSVAEAEDIVQESFLRWQRAQDAGVSVDSPGAYLRTITARLAIDHFRSARVRRESYVGIWLPEPLVDGHGQGSESVIEGIETKDTVSMALLALLERLSPIERGVFILREAFDVEFGEIARIVEKSEDNCRQIFHRAKHRVQDGRPRFEASVAKRDELARRFLAACQEGDLDSLVALLAEDVTFQGDGGGKAAAVIRPVLGRERVARFLTSLFGKGKYVGIRAKPSVVNGQPGALLLDGGDRLVSVFSIDVIDGRVQSLRSVVNPEKLRHLGATSELTKLPRSARARS